MKQASREWEGRQEIAVVLDKKTGEIEFTRNTPLAEQIRGGSRAREWTDCHGNRQDATNRAHHESAGHYVTRHRRVFPAC